MADSKFLDETASTYDDDESKQESAEENEEEEAAWKLPAIGAGSIVSGIIAGFAPSIVKCLISSILKHVYVSKRGNNLAGKNSQEISNTDGTVGAKTSATTMKQDGTLDEKKVKGKEETVTAQVTKVDASVQHTDGSETGQTGLKTANVGTETETSGLSSKV